jgi:hypothetical protein
MNTTSTPSMPRKGTHHRAAAVVAVVIGVAFATGCEVTNPGPVNDEFLTLPESQQGFVNGAKERLTRAISYQVYSTAHVAYEIFPGGTTGSSGHAIPHQAGSHDFNSSGPNGIYNNVQQARWTAEEAIRRLSEVDGVKPALLHEAHIWAGYANRVLGENWCEAVIDGGPLQGSPTAPDNVYFTRAEAHFTDALALAATANQRYAALGGRAQVRVWLKNWSGAAADAALVPNSFAFSQPMDISTGNNPEQRNQIYFASASRPYRSWSVRFTFYDQYYTDTGDPRTPWRRYPIASDSLCVGSLQGFGRVPCTEQQKYKTEDDDIRLSSGPEMRLIEAEALLVAGDWQAAMTKINGLRTSYISTKTGVALTPWTATNLNEAWTILKREHGIEMWLEGRRMGAQRRWQPVIPGPSTPGDLELPNFAARSSMFNQFPRGREITQGVAQPRALCYNISDAERNTNANIPDVAP